MLTAYKIGEADFAGKDVSSLPDQPGSVGMTSKELKAAFDRPVKEVVVPKINGLIDAVETAFEKGAYTVTEYPVTKRSNSFATSQATVQKIGPLVVLSGEIVCPTGFSANSYVSAADFDMAVAPIKDMEFVTTCMNADEIPEPAVLMISTQGVITVFTSCRTAVVKLTGVWVLPEETA